MNDTNDTVRYTRKSILCIGTLVGVTLVFPFAVRAFAHFQESSDPLETTIFVFLAAAYALPVIYLILAGCIAMIASERAEQVGMSPFVGIYVALLAFSDVPVGIAFSAFGAMADTAVLYASRMLGIGLAPYLLIAAIAALITLGLLRERRRLLNERHARAYRLWFSLLVFLMVVGVCNLLGLASMLLLGSMSLAAIVQMILIPIKSITLYPVLPVAMFLTASAYLVYVSRERDSGPIEPHPMAAKSRKNFGRRN
ncbi:hypothetical protein [Ensifer sp. LBL]|uniref:hypothetical protein n=1 Tax=Ensifer sp. LBL TaxID=2991056 RepID=UPI003D1C4EB3